MKLAEALQRRSELMKDLQQVNARITNSLVVQEGEVPPEDPKELIEVYLQHANELNNLINKVNITNQTTLVTTPGFNNPVPLTTVISSRDQARLLAAQSRHWAGAALPRGGMRYAKTEIKSVSVISPAELHTTADKWSKLARDLDVLVQATNWSTELVEV